MNTRTSILVALSTALLCACTTVETATVRHPDGAKKAVYDYTLDARGQTMNGHFREWHKNGQLFVDGHYEDGLRHGQWTAWYDNGQKRYEGRYDQNLPVGKFTLWYPDGQRMLVLDYKRGEDKPTQLYLYTRAGQEAASDRGTISKEVLTQVIRNELVSRIQQCYERGVKNDKTLGGKITLRWSIDLTGRAFNTRYDSTLDHQMTETCVMEVFNRAQFSKPKGGYLTVMKTFNLCTRKSIQPECQ